MDRRHIPFVWEGCAAKFLLQRSLVPLAPGPHGVQNGHPQARVIDMMLMDEKGVYFLTAKGKAFYAQLMEQGYIALSAAKGKVSVSLRGKIRNIGKEKLDEIFEKTPICSPSTPVTPGIDGIVPVARYSRPYSMP